MIIKSIAFSQRGMDLGMRLSSKLKEGPLKAAAEGTETGCCSANVELELERCRDGGLSSWTEEAFHSADALLFIGSCGIAVRAIAPFVKKKTEDPAVVAIDEIGRFAIPLLSGHIGGANELALKIAEAAGAVPVVTTATDINGLFAADDWARSQGMTVANPERIKRVSSKVLSGQKLRIKSEFEISGRMPECLEPAENGSYDILISFRNEEDPGTLILVPRIVTLGVGCHRNIELSALEKAFEEILEKSGVRKEAVFQAATIDLKKDEPALLEFCEKHRLPLRIFTADELMAVPGDFSGSEFVKKITGVDNVCERAAVLASGGYLINKKEAGNGVTMALAVKKPDIRWPDK